MPEYTTPGLDFLDKIKRRTLSELLLFSSSETERLVEEGIVTIPLIVEAMPYALENEARQDAQNLVRRQRSRDPLVFQYPDHVAHPDVFAWGIERGVVKPRLLKKIRYDHGQDQNAFVEEHRFLFEGIAERYANALVTQHQRLTEAFRGPAGCCDCLH